MGTWGWDEITDGATLQGFIRGSVSIDSDDGDWNFDVEPARGFKNLLVNQHGNANQNGRIQCEVMPSHRAGLKALGVDVGDVQAANTLFASPGFQSGPDEHWATVVGTWSVDKSHSVTGDSITTPGGDAAMGKTEIHPVTSVFVEHPPASDNSSRSIDFLVFSDDSSGRTASNLPPIPLPPFGLPQPPELLSTATPHAGEDRSAGFDIPIPLGSSFEVLGEVNAAAAKALTTMQSMALTLLQCRISSGSPQDGKGFYHIHVVLPGFTLRTYLLSRGIDPKAGVRELMSRGQIPGIRKLFMRLDAGTLQPLACIPLLADMAKLQSQIDAIGEEMKALQEGPKIKPKQDPALVALERQSAELQSKLSALTAKAQMMGCLP